MVFVTNVYIRKVGGFCDPGRITCIFISLFRCKLAKVGWHIRTPTFAPLHVSRCPFLLQSSGLSMSRQLQHSKPLLHKFSFKTRDRNQMWRRTRDQKSKNAGDSLHVVLVCVKLQIKYALKSLVFKASFGPPKLFRKAVQQDGRAKYSHRLRNLRQNRGLKQTSSIIVRNPCCKIFHTWHLPHQKQNHKDAIYTHGSITKHSAQDVHKLYNVSNHSVGF